MTLQRKAVMAPDRFEIRYPDGDYEIVAAERTPPAIGETIRHKGQLWKVTSTTDGRSVVVHVELAGDRAKSKR